MARIKKTPEQLANLKLRRLMATKSVTVDPLMMVRSPHRYRPGVVALQEIRPFKPKPKTMITKLPFMRLVKSIFEERHGEYRIQSQAVLALQEGVEAFVSDMYAMAGECAALSKRRIVLTRDFQLAQRMRGFK
jgi:histone H3/H4